MVFVHPQPLVIVIVCHAIATDAGVDGARDHGLCLLLAGYMFRFQYCVVGGLEDIVFGPIQWCVWSFRPSSPLRFHTLLLLSWLSLQKAPLLPCTGIYMQSPDVDHLYMLFLCG